MKLIHLRILFSLVYFLVLASLLGCGSAGPTPTPVPLVVVITATPPVPATGTPLPSPPLFQTPVMPIESPPLVLPTFAPTSTPAAPARSLTPTRIPTIPPGRMRVKIFVIAVNDAGKLGKKIGCDDSVVAVDHLIPVTIAPLTPTLNDLLSLKDGTYADPLSGQYNVAAQVGLKLASAAVVNGKAVINLSGNFKIGGVCDGPRLKAQLEETALQFSTVKEVAIVINGEPIDKVISGR